MATPIRAKPRILPALRRDLIAAPRAAPDVFSTRLPLLEIPRQDRDPRLRFIDLPSKQALPRKLHCHPLESAGGTRSPLDTPLWRTIEGFVSELEPGAALAPICTAGFTDSHWLRQTFGTVAYGFFPLRTMEAEVASRLIHGPNERIAVSDLELGVNFLRQLAHEIGGLSE